MAKKQVKVMKCEICQAWKNKSEAEIYDYKDDKPRWLCMECIGHHKIFIPNTKSSQDKKGRPTKGKQHDWNISNTMIEISLGRGFRELR